MGDETLFAFEGLMRQARDASDDEGVDRQLVVIIDRVLDRVPAPVSIQWDVGQAVRWRFVPRSNCLQAATRFALSTCIAPRYMKYLLMLRNIYVAEVVVDV